MFFFSIRLLEAAKNESIIRSQDVFSLVQYVSRNAYGKTMAWDWMTLNWDYLVNRLVHPTVERNRENQCSSVVIYDLMSVLDILSMTGTWAACPPELLVHTTPSCSCGRWDTKTVFGILAYYCLLDFEFLMQFCVKCLNVWLSQIAFFLDGALFCSEPECRSRWDAQEAGNRDCEEQYWMDTTEPGGDPGLAGEQCDGRLQHLNSFSHIPLNLSMNCSGQLENETLAKSHN